MIILITHYAGGAELGKVDYKICAHSLLWLHYVYICHFIASYSKMIAKVICSDTNIAIDIDIRTIPISILLSVTCYLLLYMCCFVSVTCYLVLSCY